MSKCLICGNLIQPFISFGKMPIANGFLKMEQFKKEYFFELKVAFCPKCTMVQLTEFVDREKMFHENYAFFSSTSKMMSEHFKEFADEVQSKYLSQKDPFVVEIGSNDGIMLQNFAKKGIRHLGVEPSKNVAEIAKGKGINTISQFFDEELAHKIVKTDGQADAFIAANVMCHIPYFHSIVAGIKILLKQEGIVMFEDPYLGDVIEKTSYDQIYDEHAFVFSVSSINYVFQQHDMEVIDVSPQEVHGGSMRYIIAHKGVKKVSKNVFIQMEREKALGLNLPETFDLFRNNCEKSRDSLKTILVDLKNKGKKVVGYAATSKSTTVLNYCGITPDLIEYICDTTPLKQGKFSPGMHIPVFSYEKFVAEKPEFALLFGWNHAKEIMAKEKKYSDSGGKWIVYVPQVNII